MKVNHLIEKGIRYLQNQEIDLNVRMLFLLEYAALFASIIGTIVMASLTSSVTVLIPNFILLFCFGLGLYFTHVKKMYNLASAIFVCGGDYIALSYMFFTSGGNRSGMPIWFLFGVAFTCMMIKGKLKLVMSTISILLPCVCMLLGQFHPELVNSLDDSQSEFVDMFQSFVIVAVILCLSLMMYLSSYDKQRKMLEQKSRELKKAINTDTLTGIANRHAFYEDSVKYADEGYKENLILVSLDVNGLKLVNDTKGHAEGDVLIKAATKILMETFSKYGNIYRIGGDEFAAILFCTDVQADGLASELKSQTEKFNEKNSANVSLAIGIAVWNTNQDKSYFELEKLADSNMYRNKNEYYLQSHKDRRRQ